MTTTSNPPLCRCGHLKKRHAFDSLTRLFTGTCEPSCGCTHYWPPDCVCGHAQITHAEQYLECWVRTGSNFCACERYRAATAAALQALPVEPQDRRRELRVPLDSPLATVLAGARGRALDLSLGGCLIEHRQPVIVGAYVPMILDSLLRRIRLQVLVVRSTVRHTAGLEPVHTSGVAFHQVADDQLLGIREILTH